MTKMKAVYEKLFKIDGTPQKVAAGLGLGVFFGVMPGMGPIIATFFAVLLRVNIAAALLGSILTNTWLSIPVFFIAATVGANITGSRYSDIANAWSVIWNNFTWQEFSGLSVYKIIFPVMIGYMIVSSVLALITYVAVFAILRYNKR
jgi:uncharacterized protein (DUF2062 family)